MGQHQPNIGLLSRAYWERVYSQNNTTQQGPARWPSAGDGWADIDSIDPPFTQHWVTGEDAV